MSNGLQQRIGTSLIVFGVVCFTSLPLQVCFGVALIVFGILQLQSR